MLGEKTEKILDYFGIHQEWRCAGNRLGDLAGWRWITSFANACNRLHCWLETMSISP